jgi:gliding motility-associated-like protein
MKQLLLYIVVLVSFFSCGDREITDTSLISDDPNFTPTTLEIEVSASSADSVQNCYYENNAALLHYVDAYDTICWYQRSNLKWVELSKTPSITIAQTGLYVVRIVKNYVVSYRKVGIYLCPCKIDNIPDAFTPNGDGVFDTWAPLGNGVSSIHFTIYSMNNSKLFESNDINVGWNGEYDGKPVPNNTYKYEITGTLRNGKMFEYRGKLTLKR